MYLRCASVVCVGSKLILFEVNLAAQCGAHLYDLIFICIFSPTLRRFDATVSF